MADAPTLNTARAREAAGDLAGADAIYRALHNPNIADPALLIGWSRLRRRLGDQQNAAAMLQAAERAGGGPSVLVDMAGLLLDQGRADDATPLLRRAAQAGRGPALDFEVARWESAHGRHEQAATLFRALMKQDPKQVAPRFGYARSQIALNRLADAETAYTALLHREPSNMQAMVELAGLLARQNRFSDALAVYDRMETAGADVVHEISQIALAVMFLCIWDNRDALLDRVAARVAREKPCILETSALLAGRDDPALHRQLGNRLAGAMRMVSAQRERPAPRSVGPADRKLRVGYLCGTFNQHTVGLQFAGVLEAHDRDRFDIIAYDYSPEDGSAVRARIKQAFPTWVDISKIGPAAAAQRIAADQIDVLVELNGYTERTRTEIIVLRPAPIQVNLLGYPGTLAGDWIDYVIADATVLPEAEYVHWTEQPVLMPATCIPNDRTRPTPEPETDRFAQELPADGVVFAAFTNPFRITPEIFAAWMDILRAVPGSALWLFEANTTMAANLRAAAKGHDIDPSRLVFAPSVSVEQHIARHGCADLFLDTFPSSAHTAVADALWAGLPAITCAGRGWPSRTGASLLHAAKLPDLITHSLEAYTALAISLAADPALRSSLRTHLLKARDTTPLFDAEQFARGLESAYTTMAERARAGAPAELINIEK
jgi:predicted O-linked N-acetylglucosamine transferase (SPINDLY family)